jgi:hypothetical protein
MAMAALAAAAAAAAVENEAAAAAASVVASQTSSLYGHSHAAVTEIETKLEMIQRGVSQLLTPVGFPLPRLLARLPSPPYQSPTLASPR